LLEAAGPNTPSRAQIERDILETYAALGVKAPLDWTANADV
jgi:hypothetical protein